MQYNNANALRLHFLCSWLCINGNNTKESITIMSMHLSLTSFLMFDDLPRIVHIRGFSSVLFSKLGDRH